MKHSMLCLVLLALVCSSESPRAAAMLMDLDFLSDPPGVPPASASSVSSGPGCRVLVVDAESEPRDPFVLFAPPGNRSLLLENASAEASSGITFAFPDEVRQGALSLEFFQYQGYEDQQALINPMLQLHLHGMPFMMYLRGARFIMAPDGEESITLDQVATVNEPNQLLIAFDTEAQEWYGWINGERLSAGNGARTRFALGGASPVPFRAVYMRPGSSRARGAWVFINRIQLLRGAVPEARRPPGRNMLPDADFSLSRRPREIYPAIGEYRHDETRGWALDHELSFSGGRSLRMAAGSPPFFWQVLDNTMRSGSYASASVFSVYLRAEAAGQQAEIGYELAGFSDGGAIQTARGTGARTVTLGRDWQRFELPLEVTASWEPNSPPPHGVRLHRAWVRPQGSAALWVDAAQLESDRLEASPFDPRRLDNDLNVHRHESLRSRQWIDPHGPRAPLPAPGGPGGSGRIALTVRDTGGFARSGEPVSGGVPFPRGALFDLHTVRLEDAAGRPVAAQFAPLAHWLRDGSIRSLGVDFQADVPAGAAVAYTLIYGQASGMDGPPPQTAAAQALASEDDEAIVIDTGAVRAVLRKDAFRWFDELTAGEERIVTPADIDAGSQVVALGGKVYASAWGPPDEAAIEVNGPLRATVVVRGRHVARGGEESLLHYTARIHAFAGKAYFVLEHVVENPEPALHTPVEAIALRLPVGTTGSDRGGAAVPRGRYGLGSGAAHDFAAPFLAVQRQQHDGPGHYDSVLEEQGQARTLDGTLLAGWIEAGGSALAIHDFHQLHPAAFEVSDALVYYPWPGRHVRAVDLPYGISMHTRLVYAPFGARAGRGGQGAGEVYVATPASREVAPAGSGGPDGESVSTLGATPLLLHADPAWVAASGVFGSFLTQARGRAIAPAFEARLDDYFDLAARDQDTLELTGKWNYGCNGTPQRWGNNEHTVSRNLWLQWLRSGDPGAWRRAWIATRHVREVDICYAGPGARAQHYHFAGTHTVPAFGLGHYWITGVLWHYLLSGDMRSLDVARAAGAMGVMASRRELEGRQRTRTLHTMVDLYETTRLQVFREAFETQYAFEQPTPLSDYHGGKNLMLRVRWYEITGDARMLARLRADAEAILEQRTSRPLSGSGGRGLTLFSGLAETARVTDDPRFVRNLNDLIAWSFLHPSFDINMLRTTEYLYQADRLAAEDPPVVPEGVWGLAAATGRGSTFRLQVAPRPGAAAVLGIHRMHRRAEDTVRYAVRSADGTLLREEDLRADEWVNRTLTFDEDVDGPGPFEVVVQGIGDARFELSGSGGVRLDARNWFRMRSGSDLRSGFSFFVKAPQDGGDIEIATEWVGPGVQRYEGSGVAARLDALDGAPVARARWVVPIGTDHDGAGAVRDGRCERLLLPVPRARGGEVLQLRVFAPIKDFRWQVRGLDTPWLARDPRVLLTQDTPP